MPRKGEPLQKKSLLGGTRQRRPGQRNSAASPTREDAAPRGALFGGERLAAARRRRRRGARRWDGVRAVVEFVLFWRAGRKGEGEGDLCLRLRCDGFLSIFSQYRRLMLKKSTPANLFFISLSLLFFSQSPIISLQSPIERGDISSPFS